MATLFTDQPTIGADFSPCRRYRYALWRHWDWQGYGNVCAFIGLNPSTADGYKNDPTVQRCVNFAKSWGYGGLVMLNLFAFRSTDPRGLLNIDDPIGPSNDSVLANRARQCGLVVAAWGVHGTLRNRDRQTCHVINRRLDCLGLTKDGHPLYVRGDTTPNVFWMPEVPHA